jgi:hypothetical protein
MNHPDQLPASPGRVVGIVGGLDRRVVYQWVIRVRLRIGDVPRVLSDGILE